MVKEKGSTNIQVKIINEEIEEVEQKRNQFQSRLNEENGKFEDLEKKRDTMQRSWLNDRNLHDMHQEVLSLMVKESVQAIEKLEQQTITQKSDIRLKMKELQIAKLQEQIEFRDQMIDEAKRIMKEMGINNELVDDRIIELDDIVYDHGSIFNPTQRDSSQLKNYSKYSPRRNSTISYQPAQN